MISIYVWDKIGFFNYVIVSFIILSIFGYLHTYRWKSSDSLDKDSEEQQNRDKCFSKLVYSAMFWPAAITYFPIVFIQRERERKERIIREIIES
jgi:hypothetical protein